MPHSQPPEPWKSFLAEIDRAVGHRLVLQCMGGFAMAMLYDLPRPTVDIDCLSVIRRAESPARCSWPDADRSCNLAMVSICSTLELSAFRRITNRDCFECSRVPFGTSASTAWKRTTSRFPSWNVILPGIRNREDVSFLASSVGLNIAILEARYRAELRPYLANTGRHDLTLRLWADMLLDRSSR